MKIEAKIKENTKLVHDYIQKHCRTRNDRDDIYQHGLIGLFLAITTHKPEGIAFSTHAYMKIRQEVQKHTRYTARHSGYVSHGGKMQKRYKLESFEDMIT